MDLVSLLPDDLLRHVGQFAIQSVKELFRAYGISKHFKMVWHDPALLAHICFKFNGFDQVKKLGLAMSSSVRHAQQQHGGRATNISNSLALMPNLLKLSLHDLWITTDDLNEGLSHVPTLTALSVTCLNMIQHLELPRSLRVLQVQGGSSLRSISGAPNLVTLHVSYCSRLSSITRMESLTELKIAACRFEVLTGRMPNLRRLDTDFFVHSAPHAIESCTGLEEVRMYSKAIMSLSCLAPLTNLRALVMWQCNELQDLRALSGLVGLVRLQLSGCRLNDMSLLSLEPLHNLAYLELETDSISNAGLSSVSKLAALRELYINCCRLTSSGLRRLEPLRNLKVFHLTRAFYVTDVIALGCLASLRNVQLSSLIQLGSVEPLSSLRHLTTLTLESCHALNSLQGLQNLPALDYLCLDGCESLTRSGLWAMMPPQGPLTHFLMCDRMRRLFEDDLSKIYQQLDLPRQKI